MIWSHFSILDKYYISRSCKSFKNLFDSIPDLHTEVVTRVFYDGSVIKCVVGKRYQEILNSYRMSIDDKGFPTADDMVIEYSVDDYYKVYETFKDSITGRLIKKYCRRDPLKNIIYTIDEPLSRSIHYVYMPMFINNEHRSYEILRFSWKYGRGIFTYWKGPVHIVVRENEVIVHKQKGGNYLSIEHIDYVTNHWLYIANYLIWFEEDINRFETVIRIIVTLVKKGIYSKVEYIGVCSCIHAYINGERSDSYYF